MLEKSDMLFLKRWTVFLVVTCICLILVTTLKHRVLPQPTLFASTNSQTSAPTSCPKLPPSSPLVLPKSNSFNWRNVTIKNPVQPFTDLPTNKADPIPKVQFDVNASFMQQQSAEQNQRRDAVKQVFLRGWNSYRSKAFLHDELAPVSGGFKDTFGGWGATLVDSLDTLWIMDLKAEFEEAVTASANLSFSPDSSSLETVNIFETTIRYLGGFIAAYDLTGCMDVRLLQKAVEMGDMIYASYDTPNRMPITRWDIRDYYKQQLPAQDGIIAELASASVEFTRLSQLTGDMRYYDAIARITNLLDDQQARTQLPGMFPVAIGTRAEDLTKGTSFSFGAMADSAFEYFGKTWQLLGGQEPQYQRLYEGAMNVASSHLLYRPSTPDQADILISANYHSDSNSRDSQFQHLACFAGGMYLLGGRLFANQTHVDIGTKLTDGCVWAYKHSPLGIMPEILEMKACPSWSPCTYDNTQESPFTIIGDPKYILRPEAIESVFYAYRITGDTKYQDIAWDMFQSIDNHTKTDFANAAIKDVMTTEHVEQEDSMESFWMSETLKYFYLVFSEPDLISLDEWVFNTEAHPFRLSRG
jgi:mannosyl-oligosaccharide alpha-1,2-mannosidase